MLDMPIATREFVAENKAVSQIAVLENALANERDLYMRIAVKRVLGHLQKGENKW